MLKKLYQKLVLKQKAKNDNKISCKYSNKFLMIIRKIKNNNNLMR